MIHATTIPCPVCGPASKIQIEISSLLQGAQFSCPACGCQVAIQSESIDTARKVIGEFEDLKKRTSPHK